MGTRRLHGFGRKTRVRDMSLVPGLGRPPSTRQTGALEDQVRAIFIFGDGGVNVEPTVSQAAAFMEPIDIENGEYEAVFDDTGRQYEMKVVDGSTRLEPTDKVDLDGLVGRIRNDPLVRSLVDTDLEHPMQVAVAISRLQWEHRWPRWPRWLSRRLHGDHPQVRPVAGSPKVDDR